MEKALEIINLYLSSSKDTRDLVEEMISAYKSGKEEPKQGPHMEEKQLIEIIYMYVKASDEVKNQIQEILSKSESQSDHLN